MRDFVRPLAKDVNAVDEHFATLNCVVFVPGHDFSERAFTGAIRAHQRVHFAFRNGEIESFKDGLPINGNMEIFDLIEDSFFQIKMFGDRRFRISK